MHTSQLLCMSAGSIVHEYTNTSQSAI